MPALHRHVARRRRRGLSAIRAGATACCSIAGCRSSSASFVRTRGGGATSSSRGRSRRSPHCARCSTWWSTATCRRPNSSTSIRRTRRARRCSRSRAPSTCLTAVCSWATTSTGPRWSATCGAFVRARRGAGAGGGRRLLGGCRTCTTSGRRVLDVRPAPAGAAQARRRDVDELRRAVDADEVGADCVQYVPLTDADREEVRLYRGDRDGRGGPRRRNAAVSGRRRPRRAA